MKFLKVLKFYENFEILRNFEFFFDNFELLIIFFFIL